MQFKMIDTTMLEELFQTGLQGPLTAGQNRLLIAEEQYFNFVQYYANHAGHFDCWGETPAVDYLVGATLKQVKGLNAEQKAGRVRNIIFLWTPGYVSLFWACKNPQAADKVLRKMEDFAPKGGVVLRDPECKDEVTAFMDHCKTLQVKPSIVDQIGLGLAG